MRFVHEQAGSCRTAAITLGLSARTLTYWLSLTANSKLVPQLRGRHCHEFSVEQHMEVEAVLEDSGPRLGLPTLRKRCPTIAPSVLGYLLTAYRRQSQGNQKRVVQALRWHRPGAVWAMDHSDPPQLIDGFYARILAIRDLGSGMQLAWTPVVDATANQALWLLRTLVARYGPPLVLKSDNGSAFTDHGLQEWLEHNGITPLFSPVRMPRYNGACEAGIGGMKRRTEELSARDHRLLDWTSDDLYAAQLWANEDHYPNGLSVGTASQRFAARLPLTDEERVAFRAVVYQHVASSLQELCSEGHALTDKLSAICHRRAVRRALVEHGYLSITQRSIPQPIKAAKCARIR